MSNTTLKPKDEAPLLLGRQKMLAWSILILLAIVWGSSFILMKKGLLVYPPLQVAALRVGFAFIFLVGLAVVRFRKVPKNKWKALFVSGLVGVFIPAFLFPLAQTHVDSAITGVLNALTPMSALVLGVVIFRQKTVRTKVVGILIGFVGIICLIFTNANGGASFNAYALFAIAATVCYGFNLNYIKHYLHDMKSLDISVFSISLVGPFALVYLFASDFATIYAHKEGSVLALVYIAILGIAGTAIALVLFNRLLQMTNPIFASSVTYLIPLVAIILGVLDKEEILPSHYIGMTITILGVWLVNRK
ncbi:DMT family transporter [uncultured Microscilla sp.]|uniref:DMT family transporter n=1 Tax=uncultured Microscilla sp. TaxID=432653 RepID=UPI0026100418|nr:DMT family transporter [uncultured Microscilla sp.]